MPLLISDETSLRIALERISLCEGVFAHKRQPRLKQVKRYKNNLAEIIGITSDQWNSIRRAKMHGQTHELYSLFP